MTETTQLFSESEEYINNLKRCTLTDDNSNIRFIIIAMGNMGSGKSAAIKKTKIFCNQLKLVVRGKENTWTRIDRDEDIRRTENYKTEARKFFSDLPLNEKVKQEKILPLLMKEYQNVTGVDDSQATNEILWAESIFNAKKNRTKTLEDMYKYLRYKYVDPFNADATVAQKNNFREKVEKKAMEYGFASPRDKIKLLSQLEGPNSYESFVLASALGLLEDGKGEDALQIPAENEPLSPSAATAPATAAATAATTTATKATASPSATPPPTPAAPAAPAAPTAPAAPATAPAIAPAIATALPTPENKGEEKKDAPEDLKANNFLRTLKIRKLGEPQLTDVPIEVKAYIDIRSALDKGDNIIYESTGRSFERIKEIFIQVAKKCNKFYYIGIALVNIIDPVANKARLIKRFIVEGTSFLNPPLQTTSASESNGRCNSYSTTEECLPPLATRIDLDSIKTDDQEIKNNIVTLVENCLCPENASAISQKDMAQGTNSKSQSTLKPLCINSGIDYIMVYDQKYCQLQDKNPGCASLIIPISIRSLDFVEQGLFPNNKKIQVKTFPQKKRKLFQCLFGRLICGDTSMVMNECCREKSARQALIEDRNVVDTKAPVITVASGTDTVKQGSTWNDAGATADGGETVTASGTVNTGAAGTYTITYTATDASGNVGTATRTVTVVNTTTPDTGVKMVDGGGGKKNKTKRKKRKKRTLKKKWKK
jgi:hypothetical protein